MSLARLRWVEGGLGVLVAASWLADRQGTPSAKSAITAAMKTEPMQRPRWDIDRRLEAFLGKDVRVAAVAFRPFTYRGEPGPHWVPVKELVLPDNSPAAGLLVFFEGTLRSYVREVAVVTVTITEPRFAQFTANGTVSFRGRGAVVLHGPAQVELAYPFSVELLPLNPENYWRDLQCAVTQFTFPFGGTPNHTAGSASVTARNVVKGRKRRR